MGALIVDPHPCVRMALAALIRSRTSIDVVGEAEDAARAMAATRLARPGIVISELSLSDATAGITFLRELKSQPGPPHIMVFSATDSPNEVVAALTAGVDSYVHKSTPCQDLADAIVKTHHGERVWLLGERARSNRPEGAASTSNVAGGPSTSDGYALPGQGRPLAPLTHRERQVLALLLRRYTNEEIAEDLILAHQTVKNHVSSVFNKIGVKNRRELLRQRARRELAISS